MMIDTHELIERVNKIHDIHKDYAPIVMILNIIRKEIHDLEADQACKNAKHKYAEALQGLKDK